MGPDDKAYLHRHGIVITGISEKTDGNVNEGGHWAAKLAIEDQADYYSWDADGMGAGLAEQNSRDFEGKHTELVMFKGSEAPDSPKTPYNEPTKRTAKSVDDLKTIGETFLNKRAQYTYDLRDAIYRTYRAVVHGEMMDPETLISFSSEIELLPKVRAQVCRMPRKPNSQGRLALYTKEELKRLYQMDSPNLFDVCMMSRRYEPEAQDAAPVLNFPRKWK